MIDGVKEIGVVGAGTMGKGIAQTFATAGYPVACATSRGAARAAAWARSRRASSGSSRATSSPPRPGRGARRIAPTTRIEDLADCDLVVEAVLERFDLKKAVIGELDRVCRADAILATNTSSISVTRIAATSKIPAASSACISSIPCR